MVGDPHGRAGREFSLERKNMLLRFFGQADSATYVASSTQNDVYSQKLVRMYTFFGSNRIPVT